MIDTELDTPRIDLESDESDLMHYVCCKEMPNPDKTFCGLDARTMDQKDGPWKCVVCVSILYEYGTRCPRTGEECPE